MAVTARIKDSASRTFNVIRPRIVSTYIEDIGSDLSSWGVSYINYEGQGKSGGLYTPRIGHINGTADGTHWMESSSQIPYFYSTYWNWSGYARPTTASYDSIASAGRQQLFYRGDIDFYMIPSRATGKVALYAKVGGYFAETSFAYSTSNNIYSNVPWSNKGKAYDPLYNPNCYLDVANVRDLKGRVTTGLEKLDGSSISTSELDNYITHILASPIVVKRNTSTATWYTGTSPTPTVKVHNCLVKLTRDFDIGEEVNPIPLMIQQWGIPASQNSSTQYTWNKDKVDTAEYLSVLSSVKAPSVADLNNGSFNGGLNFDPYAVGQDDDVYHESWLTSPMLLIEPKTGFFSISNVSTTWPGYLNQNGSLTYTSTGGGTSYFKVEVIPYDTTYPNKTIATIPIQPGTNTVTIKLDNSLEAYLEETNTVLSKLKINYELVPGTGDAIDYLDTSHSKLETINIRVDPNNIPIFSTLTARRYFNHNSQNALLVNNEDYFTINWAGTSGNLPGKSLKMTLLFNDQVQISNQTSTTFNWGPFVNAPYTVGQLFNVQGYIEDERGRRSATKVGTIYIKNTSTTTAYLRTYLYSKPKVTISAYRCTSNGTADEQNGKYIRYTYNYSCSPVDYNESSYKTGTVAPKVKVYINSDQSGATNYNNTFTESAATGSRTVTVGSKSENYSFNVWAEFTDYVGNTTTSLVMFVPSGEVFMDFRAGGKGLAVGKRSESEQFEVQWDSTFYGNVNFKGNVNITGTTQTTTTADAVTYRDTTGLGASNVQAAIQTIATRAGLTTTQVNKLIDDKVSALSIPDDAHINSLINTAIANIQIPDAGLTEAQVNALISQAITNAMTTINNNIDSKMNNYYTKQEVDNKIANVEPEVDVELVNQIVDDKLANTQLGMTQAQVEQIVDDKLQDIPSSAAAIAIANQAKSIAEDAESTAGTAIIKANTAVENAESAVDTADEALEVANQAKSIAEDAKSKIDQAVAGLAPAAEDVSFSDTISLGATNVQLAIVKTNQKILTSAQIQSMIDTKFNSIVNGNTVHY